jgi:acyl carrier protein
VHAIDAEVRQFVVENFLFGDGTELSDTQSFLETALIDSTGVLQLVGFLELRYGIVVEDRELVPANLDSIERVVRFVVGKLQAKEKTLAG